MSMKIITGNLLDLAESGAYSIIMHGCNCFHSMSGGIAGDIAKRYPCVPLVDKATTVRGDIAKLGTYSLAEVTHKAIPTQQKTPPGPWQDKPKSVAQLLPKGHRFTVINLYTQYNPGADFLPSIFPVATARVNKDFSGCTIGIPLIGCGIGGGNWEEVMDTLVRRGPDVHWEVVLL